MGRRLDWIVVLLELDIRSYEILAGAVSGHRAVIAEITLSSLMLLADRCEPEE